MTIITPAKGITFHKGDSVVISGTATDSGSGIKSVQVQVNGLLGTHTVSNHDGPWSITVSATKKGTFTIQVTAKDNAGNIRKEYRTFKVTK